VFRTFVVQLHAGAEAGASGGRFSGRVEHVASGQAFEFTSAEALVEFLTDNAAELGGHPGRNS
jgi:hypothetical protein